MIKQQQMMSGNVGGVGANASMMPPLNMSGGGGSGCGGMPQLPITGPGGAGPTPNLTSQQQQQQQQFILNQRRMELARYIQAGKINQSDPTHRMAMQQYMATGSFGGVGGGNTSNNMQMQNAMMIQQQRMMQQQQQQQHQHSRTSSVSNAGEVVTTPLDSTQVQSPASVTTMNPADLGISSGGSSIHHNLLQQQSSQQPGNISTSNSFSRASFSSTMSSGTADGMIDPSQFMQQQQQQHQQPPVTPLASSSVAHGVWTEVYQQFLKAQGMPPKQPAVGGKPLDLKALYYTVIEAGGYDKVKE